MTLNIKSIIMETSNEYKLVPGFRNSFGTGWKVMKDNFLRLFLVIVVLAIVTSPFRIFNWKMDASDLHSLPFNLGHNLGDNLGNLISLGALGAFAVFAAFLAVLYALLVAPVFKYGGDMMFVQAVRKIKPDFELLVKGFMENYLGLVLANLLVLALVIIGLFALVIPGIIIAVRLIFVSYIVMDKKLDPIEAVELSWKLTRGHGWKIFFMGIVSFFIIIFGLMLFIVGVFPAFIWVSGAFASLYESVLREKEPVPDMVTI
jgi:hypothetical protein